MTFSAEHLLKKTTANAASDILNIETRVDNDAARSSSADAVVAVVDNTTSDKAGTQGGTGKAQLIALLMLKDAGGLFGVS